MTTEPAASDHGAVRERPLEGVRVLAVEQYGAGPYASMYLADMGAEVIKIEPPARGTSPGGDTSRQSGPHFLGDNDSHFFQTFNLGKRSMTLDIRAPEGRRLFERLVATADAVLNNLRGDQPARLGLTYEVLAPLKSSIVCAHLSGFGRTGPRASWPAYDYLMQAEAGYFSLTGEPDGPPTRMGLSIVDYLAGITTAFALTSALFSALRTGVGRDVDVALFDVAMAQLTYPATWYLNEKTVTRRRPRSGHPAVVPCEVFPTRNGSIFIMCVLPKFWVALCNALGCSELVEDPRFATPKARYENRDALAAELDKILRTEDTEVWLERLGGEVPAAPILGLDAALDSPYFREMGGIQTIDHPARPGLRVLSSPIRVDGERPVASKGPSLGADTDTMLKDLGLNADEIAALHAKGVV